MSDWKECRNYENCGCYCIYPDEFEAGLCGNCLEEHNEDERVAELERLRAELAASRHELVGAKKSARAQARIIESLQQQRAHLNAQRDQWIEARNTLDSERAANARLTDELAASREREARMRGIGGQLSNVAFNLAQRAGHVISSDDCSLLDGLRKQWDAALAEGAQG